MMWLGLLASGWSAMAADEPAALQVHIEAFPPWVRRARLPSPPTPAVPISKAGRANIDGVLNEPAWASERAPPLLPLHSAPAAPPGQLVALATPDGLALGLSGLSPAAGWSHHLSVDPTGTRTHWVEVHLGETGASWRVCAPDTAVSEGAGTPPWPTGSTPCISLDGGRSMAKRGPDGWELLIAWADLPAPPLSTLRLAWFTRGPEGLGGTWHPGGSATVRPPAGRPLLYPSAARGRLAYDLENGGAALHISTSTSGAWSWHSMQSGVPAGGGIVEVPAEANTGEVWITDLPFEGAVVATSPGDEPLRDSVVVFLPRRYAQASLLTPIHRGRLTLGVHLLDTYEALPIAVRTPQGQVLGQATTTLPAGRSDLIVDIPPDWPDYLTLEVGNLLDPDTPIVRRREPGDDGGRP